MPEQEKIEELTDSLKRYVNTNYELIKLEATERTSTLASGLISVFIIGFISVLFIFFISIGIGFYLSTQMGDDHSGFVIVAGFYFVLALILILGRKKMIEKPLRDKMVQKIFTQNL